MKLCKHFGYANNGEQLNLNFSSQVAMKSFWNFSIPRSSPSSVAIDLNETIIRATIITFYEAL